MTKQSRKMWVTQVSMFTELNVYRVVSIAMPGNLHICSLKFEQRRILFELQSPQIACDNDENEGQSGEQPQVELADYRVRSRCMPSPCCRRDDRWSLEADKGAVAFFMAVEICP